MDQLKKIVNRIKNHKPRKGTETRAARSICSACSIVIKNHKPRKGTETNDVINIHVTFPDGLRTINPVRGRKHLSVMHT